MPITAAIVAMLGAASASTISGGNPRYLPLDSLVAANAKATSFFLLEEAFVDADPSTTKLDWHNGEPRCFLSTASSFSLNAEWDQRSDAVFTPALNDKKVECELRNAIAADAKWFMIALDGRGKDRKKGMDFPLETTFMAVELGAPSYISPASMGDAILPITEQARLTHGPSASSITIKDSVFNHGKLTCDADTYRYFVKQSPALGPGWMEISHVLDDNSSGDHVKFRFTVDEAFAGGHYCVLAEHKYIYEGRTWNVAYGVIRPISQSRVR